MKATIYFQREKPREKDRNITICMRVCVIIIHILYNHGKYGSIHPKFSTD